MRLLWARNSNIRASCESTCQKEVPNRFNSQTIVSRREFSEGDRKETLLRCRWRGCWRISLGDRFSNRLVEKKQ